MSDLRTRIAKALYGQILHPVPPFGDQPDEVQAAWLSDADAVIRELRLSVDRGVIIGCDGKCATNECGCPRWDET